MSTMSDSKFEVNQRVELTTTAGEFFPAGSKGTIVEDVTGKRVGRQDQFVPMGHVYRVAFDHRSNMPATYVSHGDLRAVTMTHDQEIRLRMMKRGMHVPNNIDTLKDARWAASDDDWYIETEEGEVYWWNGKRWCHCPQGAR